MAANTQNPEARLSGSFLIWLLAGGDGVHI
jgi:hypothetical protein